MAEGSTPGAPRPADRRLTAEDRHRVLRRTLRALPQPMLTALVSGLDKHGDRLVAGRLYRSRDGGGCAVGVMLRELDPALAGRGRLRFWLRDRWRGGARSYAGPIGANPRLKHLEWVFDALADDLGPTAAGRYVREEAERELGWRALRHAPTAPAAHPAAAVR